MSRNSIATTPDGVGIVDRQVGWDVWVRLQRDGSCRVYRVENVWPVQPDRLRNVREVEIGSFTVRSGERNWRV